MVSYRLSLMVGWSSVKNRTGLPSELPAALGVIAVASLPKGSTVELQLYRLRGMCATNGPKNSGKLKDFDGMYVPRSRYAEENEDISAAYALLSGRFCHKFPPKTAGFGVTLALKRAAVHCELGSDRGEEEPGQGASPGSARDAPDLFCELGGRFSKTLTVGKSSSDLARFVISWWVLTNCVWFTGEEGQPVGGLAGSSVVVQASGRAGRHCVVHTSVHLPPSALAAAADLSRESIQVTLQTLFASAREVLRRAGLTT